MQMCQEFGKILHLLWQFVPRVHVWPVETKHLIFKAFENVMN